MTVADATPAAAEMPPRSSVARRTLRATYVIWYRDLLRYTRDWARVVTSLAQPLLFLIIFGTGLGSGPGQRGGLRGGPGFAERGVPLGRREREHVGDEPL